MMKRQIVIALIAATFLGMAGLAEAGNSNRGHRDHHYRHGHHGVGKGFKIAAGALVLGSIIYAISNEQRRQAAQQAQSVVPVPDYWYRVDSDGQCVEVRLNSQGREVWTYVDPSNCY